MLRVRVELQGNALVITPSKAAQYRLSDKVQVDDVLLVLERGFSVFDKFVTHYDLDVADLFESKVLRMSEEEYLEWLSEPQTVSYGLLENLLV